MDNENKPDGGFPPVYECSKNEMELIEQSKKREFSKVAFWQLTTTLIIVFFVKSLSNFREREKSIGIILGIKDLIKRYK